MSASNLLGAKQTTEDLILEWLQLTGRKYVTSHEVQLDCVAWLESRGCYRNPATVDRKWRNLRNNEGCLKVRKMDTGGKEDTWEIISIDGIPWEDVLKEATL